MSALGAALALFWSIQPTAGSAAYAADPAVPAAPAGSTSYSTVPSEFSLTISPTRLEIAPAHIGGEHEFLVVNRGKAAASVVVQKRNFTGRPDGSLQFQQDAPYAASNWVTVTPNSFELAPGRAQIVTADIALPAAPEPGDHSLALVFLVPAGRTQSNVKINRGIATPIYITVPGRIDRSATITALHAPGFAFGGAIKISAQVHNTGNVHRDFRGPTALGVHGAGDTAFPDFTVMRGGTRVVTTTWHPPLFCICHLTTSVTNPDGSVHSKTVRVIVLPVREAAIALGVLFALVVAAVARRRHRSHHPRRAAVAAPH